MRLFTHNTLQNNAADAKGKGFPLQITASDVRVDDHGIDERQIQFVKGILPTIDWPALVKVRSQYE